MVYRLTMRTFMVFEYIHPSGIKLRPARPLTNSILYIYNPIGGPVIYGISSVWTVY